MSLKKIKYRMQGILRYEYKQRRIVFKNVYRMDQRGWIMRIGVVAEEQKGQCIEQHAEPPGDRGLSWLCPRRHLSAVHLLLRRQFVLAQGDLLRLCRAPFRGNELKSTRSKRPPFVNFTIYELIPGLIIINIKKKLSNQLQPSHACYQACNMLQPQHQSMERLQQIGYTKPLIHSCLPNSIIKSY